MSWTYEARMSRVIANLIDNGRIDRAELYKRAKFFGEYAFRVNLGVSLQQWVDFDDLMRHYHSVFDPMGAHLVGVKSTFDVYVYGNNPTILTWLYRHPGVQINSFAQTDPAYWHKKLPPSKKNMGKFYGEYRFRIRMRDTQWGLNTDNVDQLNELEMDHRLVLRKFNEDEPRLRDTFIYLTKLSEVLVLKLMFGDQVADVEDRA